MSPNQYYQYRKPMTFELSDKFNIYVNGVLSLLTQITLFQHVTYAALYKDHWIFERLLGNYQERIRIVTLYYHDQPSDDYQSSI